jgi:hypothetical protein
VGSQGHASMIERKIDTNTGASAAITLSFRHVISGSLAFVFLAHT